MAPTADTLRGFDRPAKDIPRSASDGDPDSTLIGLVGETTYNKGKKPFSSSDDSLQVLVSRWYGKTCANFEHKKQTYSRLD
jgi:hypothetical protein